MEARPLSALASDSNVLLDANIFIYAFTERSLPARGKLLPVARSAVPDHRAISKRGWASLRKVIR